MIALLLVLAAPAPAREVKAYDASFALEAPDAWETVPADKAWKEPRLLILREPGLPEIDAERLTLLPAPKEYAALGLEQTARRDLAALKARQEPSLRPSDAPIKGLLGARPMWFYRDRDDPAGRTHYFFLAGRRVVKASCANQFIRECETALSTLYARGEKKPKPAAEEKR